MSQEAEEAAMRITLRNYAPNIKAIFTTYGIDWLETSTNLYLAIRFKENSDINDPENIICSMNSTVTKRQEMMQKGQNPHMDTLYEFFPYMSELFEKLGEEWNLSLYDMFLTAKYKGDKVKDPADMVGMTIQTKKSIEPKQKYTIC